MLWPDLVEGACQLVKFLYSSADSDDDSELVSLDLDTESNDVQPDGDFITPDGTQSLVPNDVLSYSGVFNY